MWSIHERVIVTEEKVSTVALTRFCAVRFTSFDTIPIASNCPSPRPLLPALPLSPLRVPLKGLTCDVGDRFPELLANPPPFPLPDGDFHSLLLSARPRLLVCDPSRPPDYQDVSISAFDGGLEFVDDPLRQSPGLRSVQEDNLTFELNVNSFVHRQMYLISKRV